MTFTKTALPKYSCDDVDVSEDLRRLSTSFRQSRGASTGAAGPDPDTPESGDSCGYFPVQVSTIQKIKI